MFNFILRGRGAADNPDEPIPTIPIADAPPVAPPSPALTAEEIRRRRLAKLNGGSDVTTAVTSSAETSSTILTDGTFPLMSSAIATTEAVMKTDNGEIQKESSLLPAASSAATKAVPVVAVNASTSLLPPVPPVTSVKNASTPSLQLPTVPAVASRNSSSSSTSSMTTSPAKVSNKTSTTMGDLHTTIATNLALESVFLVTFRPEAAHAPIKYIGSGSGGGSNTVDYLNHTNVSEIVCTLLSEDVVVGGAIGYLVGCYRRLVEKENTVADKVREDLANCRSQVVSFIASSLGEPEMFGPNSENALGDFFQTLSESTSAQLPGLLKLLAEELTKQDTMTTVAHQLVQRCFERLDGGWQPLGCRSVLDMASFQQATPTLHLLCSSDKRWAAEVATSPCFHLEAQYVVVGARPPALSPFGPGANLQMAYNALVNKEAIFTHANAGAALEHRTLLGKPNHHDP